MPTKKKLLIIINNNKEYKQRYDNIARIVHLELCQKFVLVG